MEVQLKKLIKEHLGIVREWRNSPSVSMYMYTDHDISISEHEKWFNKIKNDPTTMYWIILRDEKPAGVVNLYDIDYFNKRCGIAHYIADSDARGKGLGTLIEQNLYEFVFETLKLNKLSFEVLEFNKAAVKLHEKCGSKLDGRLREHIFKNNQYYDVLIYTLTRQDWETIKNTAEFSRILIDY